jgi:nucleotide-binding universal stress UspA family protein
MRVVKEKGVDVLVLGTRGMGTFKRAFLGSVSDYLVHHCTCPVIIVHYEKNGEES